MSTTSKDAPNDKQEAYNNLVGSYLKQALDQQVNTSTSQKFDSLSRPKSSSKGRQSELKTRTASQCSHTSAAKDPMQIIQSVPRKSTSKSKSQAKQRTSSRKRTTSKDMKYIGSGGLNSSTMTAKSVTSGKTRTKSS